MKACRVQVSICREGGDGWRGLGEDSYGSLSVLFGCSLPVDALEEGEQAGMTVADKLQDKSKFDEEADNSCNDRCSLGLI